MGKHAMKYGFSYNRYTKNQQLFGDAEGALQLRQHSPTIRSWTCCSGSAGSYSQFQALPIRHYVNQTPSVYAMDNWHVTPRLSLQLGLRYDALPHAWERSNAGRRTSTRVCTCSVTGAELDVRRFTGSDTDLASRRSTVLAFYLNGMGLAGQNGFPRGLVINDYNTLQPRVGFSEDLFGNGKTVLRGGFGTFFERMQGNDIYNAATAPPFAYNPSASNVYFTNPSTSWVTGATAANPDLSGRIWPTLPGHTAPAVAQFSLGVQHELMPSMIWVVQYVGNLAWHQNIFRHINTFPLNTDLNTRCDEGDGNGKYPGDVCPDGKAPVNLATPDEFRTYQGYGDMHQQENTTNGNYNGFQTGLRIQNRWGLSGELDYTWSHEIDITTNDLADVSNPCNLKYDKGSGALDRRQMLSANYVYNLPFFAKSAGLVKSVLGGWELAGTVIDETGVHSSAATRDQASRVNYDPIGLDGGNTATPTVPT